MCVCGGGTGTRQGDEAGGGGGWALCREEVICQIAFHSLLGLSAACQPGRQTLSDSPPRISTYTRVLMHTQVLTLKNVSVRLSVPADWSTFTPP